MDKQPNTQTNINSPIPINTRTVGTPEGIYLLYLEDYVHTFIKKLLAVQKARRAMHRISEDDFDDLIEQSPPPKIALYGKSVEENGRNKLVISGAALAEESGQICRLNEKYFPNSDYLCSAYISRNKDNNLRFELALHNTKVILDDFYIYYDQNEEMQNYLIEWNLHKDKAQNPKMAQEDMLDAGFFNTVSGRVTDDAVRFGRLAQAHNREEVRVGFMWNAMSALSLGFVICAMVYGILAINNYNKMKDMQKSIDYCMAFISENFVPGYENAVAMLQGKTADATPQDNGENADSQATLVEQPSQTELSLAQIQEQIQASARQGGTPAMQAPQDTQAIQTPQDAQSPQAQSDPQPLQPQDAPASQPQPAAQEAQDAPASAQAQSVSRYYVVQKGDTLRTICYSTYGDYTHINEICELNNIKDPNNILYGQKLLLP